MIKSNDEWVMHSYEIGFRLGKQYQSLDMSCADYWCKLGYKIAQTQ